MPMRGIPHHRLPLRFGSGVRQFRLTTSRNHVSRLAARVRHLPGTRRPHPKGSSSNPPRELESQCT
jgi:hypothetical protein